MQFRKTIGSILCWLGFLYIAISSLYIATSFVPSIYIIFTGSSYLGPDFSIPLGMVLYFIGKKIKAGSFLENQSFFLVSIASLLFSVALINYGIIRINLFYGMGGVSLNNFFIMFALSGVTSVLIGMTLLIMMLKNNIKNKKFIILLFLIGLLVYCIFSFTPNPIIYGAISTIFLYLFSLVFLLSQLNSTKHTIQS